MAIRATNMRLLAAAAEVLVDGAAVSLANFITDGPLFDRCLGSAGRSGASSVDLDRWSAAGTVLRTKVLGKEPSDQLTQSEAVRIYQYYLPVYFWIQNMLDDLNMVIISKIFCLLLKHCVPDAVFVINYLRNLTDWIISF